MKHQTEIKSMHLLEFVFVSRNYQRALELVRKATAVPSTKTDYYDQVSVIVNKISERINSIT
jgi:hypothetical protein